MQLLSLSLHNIGNFTQLDLDLNRSSLESGNKNPKGRSKPKITVLIGDNGSGKSMVLKAIALALSSLPASLSHQKAIISKIPPLLIKNSCRKASITATIALDKLGDLTGKQNFEFSLVCNSEGMKAKNKSGSVELASIVKAYKSKLSHNEKLSLPLLAFYTAERVVSNSALKAKNTSKNYHLDGYQNALNISSFNDLFAFLMAQEELEHKACSHSDCLPIDETDSAAGEHKAQLRAQDAHSVLSSVRRAISSCLPQFSNLRLSDKTKLELLIDKTDDKGRESLAFAQLSQGEQCLIAMIADLARRLALLNADLTDPLIGSGIVLIDELDLHLHPKLQRSIMTSLCSTFSNCQFIVTSNSPLLISERSDLQVYSLCQNEVVKERNQYGEDANTVLLNVMDTDFVNSEVNDKMGQVLLCINDNEIEQAKALIAELESEILSDNIELYRLKLLLRRKEIVLENNSKE